MWSWWRGCPGSGPAGRPGWRSCRQSHPPPPRWPGKPVNQKTVNCSHKFYKSKQLTIVKQNYKTVSWSQHYKLPINKTLQIVKITTQNSWLQTSLQPKVNYSQVYSQKSLTTDTSLQTKTAYYSKKLQPKQFTTLKTTNQNSLLKTNKVNTVNLTTQNSW